MSEVLLTVQQVAEVTRMSAKFIRGAIRRGDLRTVQLGRSIRVRPAELTAYLAKHTHQSEPTEASRA